jgi:hypothetical protein
MTSEQVAVVYHPCVRRKPSYASLLPAKLSTEGSSALRCWDMGGAVREPPSEWVRAHLQLRLHISHIWIMGTGFGPWLTLRTSVERACPFWASRTDALGALPSTTSSGNRSRKRCRAPMPMRRYSVMAVEKPGMARSSAPAPCRVRLSFGPRKPRRAVAK